MNLTPLEWLILSFFSLNIVQFETMLRGWKLYKFLSDDRHLYYKVQINGAVIFWFDKSEDPGPISYDSSNPDIIIFPGGAVMVGELKYLYKSVILGVAPIFPMIIRAMLIRRLRYHMNDTRYLISK